jgi:rod shape determining protein RodA
MVKDDVSSIKNVLLLCLHGAIPIGIIILQKDMGMALVYVVIFISMLFASNIKLRYFAGGGIVLLAAVPVIWNVIFGATQRNRILALFDPLNDKYKDNMWQQNQAITALASGKIWGYGYMKGPKSQSASNWGLPERQNDMIFAVCGEELGFIGCIAVIIILVIIMIRIIIDGSRSKDAMGSMICVGIFSSFAIQIIINLGMVLRILPVCGITLPFFSSGGSSVVSVFLSIGLVLSVYMHRKDFMFAQQDEK